MERKINERILKICGKAELPEDINIEYDKDITIILNGSLVKTEEGSNQDGSVNKVYKVKIITAQIN